MTDAGLHDTSSATFLHTCLILLRMPKRQPTSSLILLPLPRFRLLHVHLPLRPLRLLDLLPTSTRAAHAA